jgi:hypothetical protein
LLAFVVVAVVDLPKFMESESVESKRRFFLPSAAVFVRASRPFAKDRQGTPIPSLLSDLLPVTKKHFQKFKA